MKRNAILLLLLTLPALMMSCSSYQKLLKNPDNDLKYSKAIEYYEKGSYLKAQQLFDQVQPFFKGTEKAEKIAFYDSYCYYRQKDFIMASYYFKTFANSYSTSQYAEEAAFMAAYCNYVDSPRPSLDQNNTKEAISSLQLFISQYPKSERIQEAQKLIGELNSKLEKKAIDIAMLYYQMDDYKASIVALGNVLKDYPDTKEKESVMYHLLQAKYQYALQSVSEKQKERFTEALDTYDEYIAGFPEGMYAKDASAIRKDINKMLNN